MKELIKNGPNFEIVESGSMVFSTPDGASMIKFITNSPGIIVHCRTVEPWITKVNVKEPQ